MKYVLFFTAFVAHAAACTAQVVHKDLFRLPLSGNGEAEVVRLTGDSLATGFVIEIRGSVPMHYHKAHSEHVYILSGTGQLYLAGDTMAIAAGDLVFIPRLTHHGVVRTGHLPLRVLSIQSPAFDGSDRHLVR